MYALVQLGGVAHEAALHDICNTGVGADIVGGICAPDSALMRADRYRTPVALIMDSGISHLVITG